MLDGIEGIMNLAAASGEDLATTSDIVTDALTAFGLKASDSGHFADILAAASSNANTNVAMTNDDSLVKPYKMAFGQRVRIISDKTEYFSILTGKETEKTTKLIFGTIRLDLTKILRRE